MFFGKKKKYEKNLQRFNFYISEIVNEANSKYSTPDCYPSLKPLIDRMIDSSRNQIENWNAETDVCTLAYKSIYNIAFDVLCSGTIHMYRGQLDPMKPGDKLLFIVDKCILYFLKNGFISQKDSEDQKKILWENINSVG